MKWLERVFYVWLGVAVAITIGYIGYTVYLLFVDPAQAGIPVSLGCLFESIRRGVGAAYCLDPRFDEIHMVRQMLGNCPDGEILRYTCQR